MLNNIKAVALKTAIASFSLLLVASASNYITCKFTEKNYCQSSYSELKESVVYVAGLMLGIAVDNKDPAP